MGHFAADHGYRLFQCAQVLTLNEVRLCIFGVCCRTAEQRAGKRGLND